MSSVSDPEPSASIVFHDDEPSHSRKSPHPQHDHSTATTMTGSVSDMKHEHDHDADHGLHGLDSTQMRNRQLSQPHLKDLDSLTHEQQTALSDMKQQVKHKYPDHEASDYTYLRFLRARKFKVPDAVEMYCKYLKWRRDYNVDEIGRNPPNELRELLTMIAPESFHKFDKFGLPAYFMKAGKANVDLMLRYVTVEDMTKTHVWGMEYSFQRAAESSARLGHNIDQFVNVVDLAGLSMGHRKLMRYIKSLAKLDQQYYPEALGKTYVINAPWVFPALWKMVSPWIDPNTRQKIHVLSGNYKQQLLERFDAKDLPKEYGGECFCGEKGCIPEYTEEETQKFLDAYEDKLGLTQTTINAGKTHEIKLKTGKYGSTIHYYFKTLKSELGYQVVFKPDERKPETVWQRHVKIEGRQPYKGYYATDKPGTVIITFDNKHSYWHAESIRQMFTVNDRTEGSSPLPIQRQLSIGSRDMFDDDEKEHGSAPASPTHQRNGSQ